MSEQITDQILDDFEAATKYDISQFLADYISFIETDYSTIANYYSGFSDINPKGELKRLDNLIKEQKKIIEIIGLNANTLANYEFWVVTEYIEDIGNALETAYNSNIWLRSSQTKDGFKRNIVMITTTAQNQGLEELERDNLKSNDPDSWVDTALQNQLREEDYTLAGGYLIKVIYKNNSAIALNSVIDNVDAPEKTYGKDIDRRVIIDTTESDLTCLSHADTLAQSAKILTDLKKGDDPDFIDRGLDVKNTVGGNIAAISYPIIFRQLAGNFATDDSFKSFAIKDIKRDIDALFVEFEVETRSREIIPQSLPL